MRIPPSVLKQHNKRDDAWTAINGKVYNMTAYLPFHPGGEKELMRVAGRDGTKLFGEWPVIGFLEIVLNFGSLYSCLGQRRFHVGCLSRRVSDSRAIDIDFRICISSEFSVELPRQHDHSTRAI